MPTSDDVVLTQSEEIFNNSEWLASVDALCAMMTKKHVGEEVFSREVHEKVTPVEVHEEVRKDVIPMEVREEVIPREEIPNLVVEPARDVTPPTVDKGKVVVDVGVL